MAENSLTEYATAAAAFVGTVFSYFAGRSSGKKSQGVQVIQPDADVACAAGAKHAEKINALEETVANLVTETDQRFDQGTKVMDGMMAELKFVRSSVDRMIGWIEGNQSARNQPRNGL